MKVESESGNAEVFPGEESFTVELNKSTLDALLAELGKVEAWLKKVHKS